MKVHINTADWQHYLQIELPFWVGFQKQLSGFTQPLQMLPFELGISDSGVIVRPYDDAIHTVLERSYSETEIYATLGTDDFSDLRLQAALKCMTDAVGTWEGKKVLEIGSGTGLMLAALKERGAQVFGCEPSPHAEIAEKKYGIPVIRAPFSAALFSERFDVVFHHAVLEHIPHSDRFMNDTLAVLAPGGVIIAGVPNCELEFQLGDLRIISHEHWNYFTSTTAQHAFEAMGLIDVTVRKSEYDSVMFISGKGGGVRHKAVHDSEPVLEQFAHKLAANLEQLQTRIDAAHALNKHIGIYGVDSNLFAVLDWHGKPPRTFDGDSGKHGLYFLPHSAAVVESPARLQEDPVDEIWIAPITHDAAIRHYLDGLSLPGTTIVSLLVMYRAA